MKVLTLLLTLILTGCGTYGEPLIISKVFYSYDPCLTTNYVGNTPDERAKQVPNFCGAGSGTKYYTRDYRTNAIVATTQANVFGPNTFSSNAYYH